MVPVEAFRVEVLGAPIGGIRLQMLTLVGNGWHPWLFREETKSLMGEIEVLHPRVVSVPLKENTNSRFSRAALIDDVLENPGALTINEGTTSSQIGEAISEWSAKFMEPGTFAVRSRSIGIGMDGISSKEIEMEVGARISSRSNIVELEDPEIEISVVIAGQTEGEAHPDPFGEAKSIVVWGIRNSDWERENYSGRSPTDRPFFKPVSLEPRQARLLISLGHRPGREVREVVDPFCGTGGIVIEAALQGLGVLASDLDSRMVEGTKENLDWVGADYRVERCNASEIGSIWGKRSDCVFAFDPPYGRSSWKSEDGLDLFLSALSSAREVDPGGVISTMLPTGPEVLSQNPEEEFTVMGKKWSELEELIAQRGWRVALKSPIKVHRSLARMVIVCHPSD